MYNGSISISLFLLFLCAGITFFTAYILTVACDVTDKWSYTEVFSFTTFPDRPLHEQSRDDGEEIEDIDEGIILENETNARKRRRQVTMIMEGIVFFTNFGTVVIYSRVIADSIPPVLTDFFGLHGVWVSEWLWLVFPSTIFFALSCVRNMEELKFTSIIGFATIFYVVVAVVVRYFTNISDPISPPHEGGVDTIRWFDVRVTMFSTLATYALAFGYHFNVPYFYCELKDRRPIVMMETVKVAFPIITVLYASTGILGYLTFGALVADSHAAGNIVSNYADDDVFVNIGRLGLFFHFATVYPILSVCARRGLHRFICLFFAKAPSAEEEKLTRFEPAPGDPSTTRMTSIIMEALVIVTGSTLIAAFVPGIGVVVELIGTLSGFPSVIIIPAYIGTKIFDDRIKCMEGLPNKLLRRSSHVCFWLGNILLVCGIVSFILERLNIN
eukprot:GILI01007759.1.p1 GENE.GILI01007759.1~~GILI01007759.1.p1  ORF type:complete len:495 (+),score=81.08 GILI01007759.1:157-1485(+)